MKATPFLMLFLLGPSVAWGTSTERFALPQSTDGLISFMHSRANTGSSLDHLFDAASTRGTLVTAFEHRVKEPRWAPPRKHKSSRALIPPQTRRYRRLVRKMNNRQSKIDQFDPLILKYSEKHKLNPRLIKAVIAAESEFKKTARSRSGALGLMQLMPRTAEFMGVPRNRLHDPEANIRAGAAYLAYLFKIMFKRNNIKGSYANAPKWIVRRVLSAYNAGMRFLRPRRLYRETRNYLAKILAFSASSLADIRRPLPLATGKGR